MKICVVMTVLDPFKGGNHLSLLAACTDTQFTIVCNRSKVSESDLPSNVSVITVSGKIGSYYYGISDFLFGRIILKKFPSKDDFWKQFEVIHINQTMGPALRQLKHCRVPVLFLIHHPVTADREVAISESSVLESIKWRAKYSLLSRWQCKLCAVTDRVATVSQTMKKRISGDYKCPEGKISVVPNGVDGSEFIPVSDSECQFDVIAVGSFVHPRKGFPYLIELYRRLSQSGIKIADVGRRSNDQIQVLQSVDGVTVHGTVDGEKLVGLMRHSRVLVSTSLFEGFGLSLIEALACGHPAFAFDVGAVPEVLSKIDPSLIIPARNTDRMAQSVTQFLSLSSEERDNKGVSYREAVLHRYSLNESANSLQSVYRSMIS